MLCSVGHYLCHFCQFHHHYDLLCQLAAQIKSYTHKITLVQWIVIQLLAARWNKPLLYLPVQVYPADATQWTKVDYDNDGVVSDFSASGVLVSIVAANNHDHARISGVTVDACLPQPRNMRSASLSACLIQCLVQLCDRPFFCLMPAVQKRRILGPWLLKKKSCPYSITERRVPELIPVLGSQHACDMSHKPGVRLPLLSARPAVTPTTLKRAATNFAAWWTEAR